MACGQLFDRSQKVPAQDGVRRELAMDCRMECFPVLPQPVKRPLDRGFKVFVWMLLAARERWQWGVQRRPSVFGLVAVCIQCFGQRFVSFSEARVFQFFFQRDFGSRQLQCTFYRASFHKNSVLQVGRCALHSTGAGNVAVDLRQPIVEGFEHGE